MWLVKRESSAILRLLWNDQLPRTRNGVAMIMPLTFVAADITIWRKVFVARFIIARATILSPTSAVSLKFSRLPSGGLSLSHVDATLISEQ